MLPLPRAQGQTTSLCDCKPKHFVIRAKFASLAKSLDLSVLVWRDPPRDSSCLGSVARNSEPLISQVFVVPANQDMEDKELQKKMFMLRKVEMFSCLVSS